MTPSFSSGWVGKRTRSRVMFTAANFTLHSVRHVGCIIITMGRGRWEASAAALDTALIRITALDCIGIVKAL